jgi:hypothetical protein
MFKLGHYRLLIKIDFVTAFLLALEGCIGVLIRLC